MPFPRHIPLATTSVTHLPEPEGLRVATQCTCSTPSTGSVSRRQQYYENYVIRSKPYDVSAAVPLTACLGCLVLAAVDENIISGAPAAGTWSLCDSAPTATYVTRKTSRMYLFIRRANSISPRHLHFLHASLIVPRHVVTLNKHLLFLPPHYTIPNLYDISVNIVFHSMQFDCMKYF